MNDSPDAILIWNPDFSGASIALGVDAISPKDDPRAFMAAGIDEDAGVGYVERRDGSRVQLTGIGVDVLSAALDSDVLVVNEVTFDGQNSREYAIECRPQPEAAPTPGF